MYRKAVVVSILIISFLELSSQIRIKMQESEGVYYIPCKVNGLNLNFILDTGASQVSISLSEALFMLKNGYMDESDILGLSDAQMANGDIVECSSIILREIEVGGMILKNVEAIVVFEPTAPLLLGQSAIQKLGKIQIEEDELLIFSAEVKKHNDYQGCNSASQMLENATGYYNDDLFNNALGVYQEVYDNCPSAFNESDLARYAIINFINNDFDKTVKYFTEVLKMGPNKELKYFSNLYIGNSKVELDQFYDATLYFKKAVNLTDNQSEQSYCYSRLGHVEYTQMNYQGAIELMNKAIELQLDYLRLNNSYYSRTASRERLGELFWELSLSYHSNREYSQERETVIESAKYGYDKAIQYCQKKKITILT